MSEEPQLEQLDAGAVAVVVVVMTDVIVAREMLVCVTGVLC